jgi:hypothetical protein
MATSFSGGGATLALFYRQDKTSVDIFSNPIFLAIHYKTTQLFSHVLLFANSD